MSTARRCAVRVCDGLEPFGFVLDHHATMRTTLVVSRADSPISVMVVPTDEELAIAEHTAITVAAH